MIYLHREIIYNIMLIKAKVTGQEKLMFEQVIKKTQRANRRQGL